MQIPSTDSGRALRCAQDDNKRVSTAEEARLKTGPYRAEKDGPKSPTRNVGAWGTPGPGAERRAGLEGRPAPTTAKTTAQTERRKTPRAIAASVWAEARGDTGGSMLEARSSKKAK